ncbi:hypothetical protein AOLI_G00289020 [Acnodon oligacanthus]
MRREDSQKKNSWTTVDSIRKSPIIPDPSCLDRMERERQEYLEGRGRKLRELNSKYEQTQEVILRRIRSSIQDHDHPSTHNALHHQSTRRLHRPNDICVEPQMKRRGLGHILLKPLRETKACSSMKSLPGSDVDPPNMKPFPPSDEPRKRERPYRRVRGLKMAVEQDCSPFRPEDPSPELCAPEPAPSPKPSRLPRLKSLLMGVKDEKKTDYTPGRKIGSLRDLVRQRSPGEDHVEPVDSRNVPEVAELSQERRSEAQLGPNGNKPAALRQRRRADSNIKPAESRAAPKAVDVSQGRAETLETPALISEQPLKNPELALRQTFKLLQEEEWEKKIEGLKLVSALAEHHAEVLLPELHDICLTVIQEVKNLRSMVSRAAMTTLAHLYAHLQRKMDQEVEITACVLLHKAGESSQFIREDVEAALSMMVQNCSPGRVLHALLTGGLSHRNAAVRRCTAQHLEKLACLLGASRLLNGKKDFTCRFLTAVSKLALDSAQEVRLHARNALRFLGSHEGCLQMVEKFVAPRDKTSIKDIVTKSR